MCGVCKGIRSSLPRDGYAAPLTAQGDVLSVPVHVSVLIGDCILFHLHNNAAHLLR